MLPKIIRLQCFLTMCSLGYKSSSVCFTYFKIRKEIGENILPQIFQSQKVALSEKRSLKGVISCLRECWNQKATISERKSTKDGSSCLSKCSSQKAVINKGRHFSSPKQAHLSLESAEERLACLKRHWDQGTKRHVTPSFQARVVVPPAIENCLAAEMGYAKVGGQRCSS